MNNVLDRDRVPQAPTSSEATSAHGSLDTPRAIKSAIGTFSTAFGTYVRCSNSQASGTDFHLLWQVTKGCLRHRSVIWVTRAERKTDLLNIPFSNSS